MNCTIAGCPGTYQLRDVPHTVRQHGELVVIDHVPAEVCDVCGDVLFTPETVRQLEHLLTNRPRTDRSVPVYEFA